MAPELLKAHNALDREVDRALGAPRKLTTERQRQELFFENYEMSQVLFRLNRWENLEYAEKIRPGCQGPRGPSRGRPHLGGKHVDASRVPGSSPKAGGLMAHSSSMDLSLPGVQESPQSLCLKIWPPKTQGYAVKIKSYAILMSC